MLNPPKEFSVRAEGVSIMKRKELHFQVLSALRKMNMSLEDLEDGPTVILVANGRRAIPVRIFKTGDCLKISTGKVLKRTTKIPLESLCETDQLGPFHG